MTRLPAASCCGAAAKWKKRRSFAISPRTPRQQYPGIHIVVVFPRREQAMVFSKSRLLPTIASSPVLRRVLMGATKRKLDATHMRFANKSEVFIRAAFHSADAVRGIDEILADRRLQDIAGADLPVLEESASLGLSLCDFDRHAKNGRQSPRGGIQFFNSQRMVRSVCVRQVYLSG